MITIKPKISTLALINLGNIINAINLFKLSQKQNLLLKLTNIRVKNIDVNILQTYYIMVIAFILINKTKKLKFNKKTFLVANVSIKLVFKIFLLILNHININFSY